MELNQIEEIESTIQKVEKYLDIINSQIDKTEKYVYVNYISYALKNLVESYVLILHIEKNDIKSEYKAKIKKILNKVNACFYQTTITLNLIDDNQWNLYLKKLIEDAQTNPTEENQKKLETWKSSPVLKEEELEEISNKYNLMKLYL